LNNHLKLIEQAFKLHHLRFYLRELRLRRLADQYLLSKKPSQLGFLSSKGVNDIDRGLCHSPFGPLGIPGKLPAGGKHNTTRRPHRKEISDTGSENMGRRSKKTRVNIRIGIIVALVLSSGSALAQPNTRRGLSLAREHCVQCHAIDEAERSPLAAAPPFRTLHLKYAVSDLQRPLTQGPHQRFRFEPSQIEDLMAYLKALGR
jgi:cytochrome c